MRIAWMIYLTDKQLSINAHQTEILLAVSSQYLQPALCHPFSSSGIPSRSRRSSWPRWLHASNRAWSQPLPHHGATVGTADEQLWTSTMRKIAHIANDIEIFTTIFLWLGGWAVQNGWLFPSSSLDFITSYLGNRIFGKRMRWKALDDSIWLLLKIDA